MNVIPVIAKADTMTPEEVSHFKRQILNQIVQSKIKIYDFPDYEDGEAEENERRENQRLKERVPFAVVGSNTIIETAEGKKVRGRKYPWGIVDVSMKIYTPSGLESFQMPVGSGFCGLVRAQNP